MIASATEKAKPVPAEAMTRLNISDLVLDLDLQARATMNLAKIEEYAESFQDWTEEGEAPQFPPIDVYEVDGELLVADGFHRVEGARKAGRISISARLYSNATREQAIIAAAGSNTTHGLPRTNADKRKAVAKILGTEVGSSWSDREIARWCGVSAPFAAKIRGESTANVYSQAERKGRDGRIINTANIGRKSAPALEDLEALTQGVDKGFQAVRDSLAEIRSRELYCGEGQYETFEAYLEGRWGIPQDLAKDADDDRLEDLMLTAYVAKLFGVPVGYVLAAMEIKQKSQPIFDRCRNGTMTLRQACAHLGILFTHADAEDE